MAASNASSVATNNLSHASKQGNVSFNVKSSEQSGKMDLEQLQHMINCTVKKNPKAELSKTDLLRLLGYLEGELQARDIVIATLKADRVKQLVSHARYGRLLPVNDPYVALQRDGRSATLGVPSSDDAALLKAVSEGPMAALDALVAQHRKSHVKLIQAMQEAEMRHSKVLRELEEEKRKHEHDTAQGDDITYGLEKERTRLREELEIEKQAKKKLEKEAKKIQETLDEERQRQKQIVLLLLAERKKLILKYVEERKKSEDLAQILSEEKGRVDSMAEGLEEESQKALQMEAELEKQLALFDGERAQLKAQLSREEKRNKELELMVDKLQMEVDSLKKQQAEAHQVAMFQAGLSQPHSPPRMVVNRPVAPVLNQNVAVAPVVGSNVSPPQLPSKPLVAPPQTPPRASSVSSTGSNSPIGAQSPRASPGSTSVPLASVPGHVVLGTTGKVIQPTATVNSTPVPAPTTGIARAVSPGGGIRNAQYSLSGATTSVGAALITTVGSSRTLPPPPSSSSALSSSTSSVPVVVTDQLGEATAVVRGPTGTLNQQTAASLPRVAVSASPGTKVFTTTNKEGKVTFHVTTSATLPTSAPIAAATAVPGSTAQASAAGNGPVTQPSTPRKTNAAIRGAPPPVPPNKPVIPPKKTSTSSATSTVPGSASLNSTSTANSTADESGSVVLHMGV